MPLGLYLSVPFCRTKCSYCNFASDVFSRAVFQQYVDRVCADMEQAAKTFAGMGAKFEPTLDSIYLGGGTPTLLEVAHLERLFFTISQNFSVQPGAEITVECAPGTLSGATIECLARCGVNRVSLGVQSFVDREAAAVGRVHTGAKVLDDISRLCATGISNFNLDLIAGLPHQDAASWDFSLNQAIASTAPHISVYMLEIDEDSRLGRELIAGGTRYHAHAVPDDELTANLYLAACERLQNAGIEQYEISNFARAGSESRHNLKYWTREPYVGFGVDAHSMLPAADPELDALRFATGEALEEYVTGAPLRKTKVSWRSALEETFFLGLRLNRGVNLTEVEEKFGEEAVAAVSSVITELLDAGLLQRAGTRLRLTARGRLLSNEVFEGFILSDLGEQFFASSAPKSF